MNKHTATLPDGTTDTKNAKKETPYAWALMGEDGTWSIGGYSVSEKNAANAMRNFLSKSYCTAVDGAMVPVTIEEI